MRHRLGSSLLTVLTAAVLAGCGISDPYNAKPPTTTPTSTATSSTTTNPEPAPERGGKLPAGAQAAQNALVGGAGQPTPQRALERYARLYVNWTAATVAPVQRKLAAISTGQARAQAMQAAASYAKDGTLAHSGVANSGHLVATTKSLTTRGQWVLVTSEQTTGKGDYSGLPATLHVIYAQVTFTSSGWVVTEWAPQN